MIQSREPPPTAFRSTASGVARPSHHEPLVWGRPPLPLLPAGLRKQWAEEALPDWVTDELGLQLGATFSALDSNVWKTASGDRASRLLRKFLTDRIDFRLSELRSVRLLDTLWPRQLEPRGFPWSERILRSLSRASLLDQPVRLSRATVWELRRLKHMGAVSVLEFAGVAEMVLAGPDAGLYRVWAAAAERATTKDDAWAHDVHAHDPRFRPLLALHAGTLGSHVAQLRAELIHVRAALRQFRSARSGLRARFEQIRTMSLEAALVDLVQATSSLSDAQTAALVSRLGLDGTAALSLHAAGARGGVSNERMRQIEQRFLRQLPKEPLFLPQLDEAIGLLERIAPCLVSRASSALQERGLGQGDRNVAMVLTAAQIFGRRTSVEVDSSGRRLILADRQRRA
jgi:hypothetical protein